MKKLLYCISICSFLLGACKKLDELPEPIFSVVTEKTEYKTNENIKFVFEGSPAIITLYSGSAGNDYEKGEFSKVLKAVNENPLKTYFHSYTKEGTYKVVFIGINQNVKERKEYKQELTLTITK